MAAPSTPVLSTFTQANGAPIGFVQAIISYSVPPVAADLLTWPQYPSLAWGTSFSEKQECYGEIGVLGTVVKVLLRFNSLNSGSETGYAVQLGYSTTGASDAAIGKFTAGSETNVAFIGGAIPTGYKYFWASAIGNVITGYASPDGVTWTQMIQYTDTSSPYLIGGSIGLYNGNNSQVSTIVDFGGGTLGAANSGFLALM
jgi:hypothetical protein